jgi:hypothetical protein
MKSIVVICLSTLVFSGCVVAARPGGVAVGVAPVGVVVPPGVVYVGPTTAAPRVGYYWAHHPRYGWGWRHPRYGWYRRWR